MILKINTTHRSNRRTQRMGAGPVVKVSSKPLPSSVLPLYDQKSGLLKKKKQVPVSQPSPAGQPKTSGANRRDNETPRPRSYKKSPHNLGGKDLSIRQTWPSVFPAAEEETTVLNHTKETNEEEILLLKKEVAHLQDENKLLRLQKFNQVQDEFLTGPPQTVSVPLPFQHVFKKAEAEVAHFFQQKIEDPKTATIGIMKEV